MQSKQLIWRDRPGEFFTDALPLGNGRLGAMVYGGVAEDRVSLNYDELWTGFPRDENRPDAVIFDFNELREIFPAAPHVAWDKVRRV